MISYFRHVQNVECFLLGNSRGGTTQNKAEKIITLFQLIYDFACRVHHKEGSCKPGWLEIKRTHQLLVYADEMSILGGSIQAIKTAQKRW